MEHNLWLERILNSSETGLPHTSFPVGGHTMGAFPNATQCLICSESSNSLISLYCSGDTPAAIEFPTDPGISTSMSWRYLQAVPGFFQNARCITVGRSSSASACVSAPPDRKECMMNAVRSPALRACTLGAFVISGADMDVFPLMGAPVFGRREIIGKRYPYVMFQPSVVPTAMYCSTALMGHVVIRLVSYSTVMRWSAPSRLVFPHWKLKRKPHSFGSRNMRCMCVRLNPSPLFKVLNATVNRAISLAKHILS